MKVKELAENNPEVMAMRDFEEYGYPQYYNGTESWLRKYHDKFSDLSIEAIKNDEEQTDAQH